MQPKLAPINLQPGDEFKQPFGVFEILDRRGGYTEDGDSREWYIRDPDTGEECWVDYHFLRDIMQANVAEQSGVSG